MRILTSHEGKYILHDGKYYTSGGLHHKNISQYLEYFDEVLCLGRFCEDISDYTSVQGLTLASHENTEFRFLGYKNRWTASIFHRSKIKATVKELINQIDCASIRHGGPINGIICSVLRKAGIPYYLEVTGDTFSAFWTHGIKGKLMAPLMYLVVRRRIKNAPYAMYVTNEYLQKKYPSRGYTSSFSRVTLAECDEEVINRRLQCIRRKEKTTLVIGTIAADVNVRRKGQQYVIKALGMLKKQGITNFKYQLLGSGDQSYLKSVAIRNNVIDQVEFLGLLPHDRVFEWLDSIDIYCQPSRSEGLPRALIEAMSRGIPACGARTAGIPELLDDEFVFSKSRTEVEEISALLVKMQSPQVLEDQAKRNFEEAKKYSKDVLDARRKEFLDRFKEDMHG